MTSHHTACALGRTHLALISQTYLTVFNNEIYFQADDGTSGKELFKYEVPPPSSPPPPSQPPSAPPSVPPGNPPSTPPSNPPATPPIPPQPPPDPPYLPPSLPPGGPGQFLKFRDQMGTTWGDPHLNLANGGQADFRGVDNQIFSFLSAPNVSISVVTEDRSFVRWGGQVSHTHTQQSLYVG